MVESLALAVVRAGGNALLISPDNTSDGFVSIRDAVESGRAFTVEVKRGLIALDLDSPELVELGERARKLCEDSGLSTLTVASGQDGRRHLFVWAGSQVEAVTDHLRAEGFPGVAFRKSIRPPLAPHRLGLEPALIRPESVVEALEVLGPPDRFRNLSDADIRLIEEGDTEGRFDGNRSAMALSIAARMRLSGGSLDEFRAAMLNRDNAGGAKAHELQDQRRDVDAFLVRTWDKAANAATFAPEPVGDVVGSVVAAVHAASWSGRSGLTDRAVMLALCSLAVEHGTREPTFGVRRITEVAQLGSDQTTRKALARLVAAGCLARIENGPRQADGYRFRRGSETTALATVPPGIEVTDAVIPDPWVWHPAFRAGSGLGKSAGLVWSALRRHGPQTVPSLVEMTHRGKTTVKDAVKRLAAFGLAEKTEEGWRAIGDETDLDRIAEQTGAADKARRQADSHDLQRWSYHQSDRGAAAPDVEPDDEDEIRRRFEDEHELPR
ncbi:hypothetical protein [Pseudonocardia acaciae]|uniref:hypothetical protein n=1 Tax=Pseudonocardia acaciae TaxID=551276 RepID=UPI0012EEB353|nr:hypothetical protein [Pseudonocardia acaciae]